MPPVPIGADRDRGVDRGHPALSRLGLAGGHCEGLVPYRQVLTLPAVVPAGDVAVYGGRLRGSIGQPSR